MRVSIYQKPIANPPLAEPYDCSWGELVAWLKESTYFGPKEGAPGWAPHDCGPCPATCRKAGTKSDCGGGRFHRLNENVRSVSALVLDLDGRTDAEAARVLQAVSGYSLLLHTTYSHGAVTCASAEPTNSLRLILPLKTPVPARQWRGAWESFVREKGLDECAQCQRSRDAHVGPQTHEYTGLVDWLADPARFYYVPSAPSAESPREFEAIEGELLELRLPGENPLLSAQALPARQSLEKVSIEKPPGTYDLATLRQAIAQGAWGRLLVAGEPLASVGGRHNAIRDAANEVAKLCPDEAPDEALMELFAESLSKMDLGGIDAWSDLAKAFESARPWWAERRAARAAAIEAARESLRRQAATLGPSSVLVVPPMGEAQPESQVLPILSDEGRYTPEALALWAKQQGCTPEDFERRWIVSKDGAHFLFAFGHYQAAVSEQDVAARAQVVLRPAPVRLEDSSVKDGVPTVRRRGIKALREDYGFSPLKLRASLCAERSYYDIEEDTFVEAIAPLRPLTARRHTRIEEWLALLCPQGDLDALLDWIATAHRLDKATSALYLAGPPGVGKSLLARGLSRLWTRWGFTEMDNFVGAFNSAIVNCPLVFADEKLPQEMHDVTASIRRMLGNDVFELRRKFLPSVMVEGYPRLIIAANDDRLFEKLRGQDLNSASVEAVAERIRVIPVRREAREYLSHIPALERARWAYTGDLLAEHALWLRDTRKVPEDQRFLVPGKMVEMHQLMAISAYSSAVLQFLARALGSHHPRVREDIRIGGGELKVRGELFQDQVLWEKLVGDEYKRSAVRCAEALREHLSEDRGTVRDEKGKGRRWYRLKVGLLYLWMERNGVGDVDEVRAMVEKPLDGEQPAGAKSV